MIIAGSKSFPKVSLFCLDFASSISFLDNPPLSFLITIEFLLDLLSFSTAVTVSIESSSKSNVTSNSTSFFGLCGRFINLNFPNG